MRAAAAFLAAALVAAGPAFAEDLTVALSTSEIRIDSNFTGAAVTVFGVIERDASTVSRPASYEVAVVLRGPSETVVARRKDRIVAIWANSASETFILAPSYYSVSSSRPLPEVSTEQILERFQIGLDHIAFTYARRARVNDPAAAEFRDAFIRLKTQSGLYASDPSGVDFIGSSVFRSTIWVPANVSAGRYEVTVYLFAGDALVAQASENFGIVKTGFEQFMFNASREHAFLYGLACVFLALFTGWLAGVIFRRD